MAQSKRIILLTGATRGLGAVLFQAFRENGHIVYGCGRSAPGNDPHLTQLDVTDDAAVGEWISKVVKDAGSPNLVINNAALIARSAPLWELSAEEFDQVIDVNLKGVANVLRHVIPPMQRLGGVIANISSGWGRSTSPEVAAYCCTKWGIEGLSQALAQEIPPGIGVVSVNPGIIDTEMLRSCFGAGAGSHIKPDAWARTAAPFFLKIRPESNGSAMTVS